MAVIFVLSSMPVVPGVDRLDVGDKVLHAIGYGVLAALVWRALDRRRSVWWRAGTTVLIAAVYGLSDEVHQRFVPGRDCDLMDLAADAVGASIVAAVALVRETVRARSAS